MKEHKSFLLYKDNIDLLEDLSDEEKGVLFQALYDFACYGVEPGALDRTVKAAYRSMRNAIARDDAKYQEKCERNSENAIRRWAKELDISFDSLKSARKSGIPLESLRAMKDRGENVESYILSMRSHAVDADSDNDRDSDSGNDNEIGMDRDTDRDSDKDIDSEIDRGRGVSEGKPIPQNMENLMAEFHQRKQITNFYE